MPFPAPPLPLFPRLNFILDFSSSLPAAQGDGEWGLRSVPRTLSAPLLPSQGRAPHTAPAWVLPTGCSPSGTGCSSVGPSHGVQSLGNRLPQHGSPVGSQVLPANLLQRGLLSSQVLPGALGLMAAGHSLPCHGLCHSCRGTSAPAPGAPPALLLHWPWALQGCCSRLVSLLYPAAIAQVFPPS